MIPFLPGGRRDPETDAHLRARSLLAARLDGPLQDQDEGWLEAHLAECDPCLAAGIDYREQADLLRSMPWPEPPRDLAARTRAAIELERGRRSPRRTLVPLGALSGALVVAVVVGASLLSQPSVGPVVPSAAALGSSPTPFPSPLVARATPIPVGAGDVGWLLQRDDGSYALSYATVDQVCPAESKEDCPPLTPPAADTLTLDSTPRAVVGSPGGSELVVVEDDTRTSGGSVLAVPVPTATPSSSSPPSPAPPSVEPSASAASSPSPEPTPSTPASSAEPSVEPSPSPSPAGPVAIASDVIVVGEAASYSPTGAWFAFSARPSDGTQGPDIYVWRTGDPAARIITADHGTVFSGWFGDLIVASRPDPIAPASGEPGASPTTAPDASTDPGSSLDAGSSPQAGTTTEPSMAPSATGRTVLLDPATGEVVEPSGIDAWRPMVDPTGRLAIYWDGSLAQDPTGFGWLPDVGSLVLGHWQLDHLTAQPSASAGPSADASASPASDASPSAEVVASPTPRDPLVTIRATLAGAVTDWDVHWDETGTRFALWIADPFDPSVGELSLHLVDRATGTLDPGGPLLADTPAQAGFSIGHGRVAWVTPPGQDGEGSRIQVLAWRGTDAGQIESDPEPGSGPVIVIR
jgi:hypothetical protein